MDKQDDELRSVFSKLKTFESDEQGITFASIEKQLPTSYNGLRWAGLAILLMGITSWTVWNYGINEKSANGPSAPAARTPDANLTPAPSTRPDSTTTGIAVKQAEMGNASGTRTSNTGQGAKSFKSADQTEHNKIKTIRPSRTVENENQETSPSYSPSELAMISTPIEEREASNVLSSSANVVPLQAQADSIAHDSIPKTEMTAQTDSATHDTEAETVVNPAPRYRSRFIVDASYLFGVLTPNKNDAYTLSDYEAKPGFGLRLSYDFPVSPEKLRLFVGPVYQVVYKPMSFTLIQYGEKYDQQVVNTDIMQHQLGVSVSKLLSKFKGEVGLMVTHVISQSTSTQILGENWIAASLSRQVLTTQKLILSGQATGSLPFSGQSSYLRYYPIQVGLRVQWRK